MSDSSPEPVVATPRPGLRARKKAATMRHIQDEALRLFEARGFDAVSIEQVAEAALVSPSTVYRYFGTKEGLILHDEYDDRIRDQLGYYLMRGTSLVDAVTRVLDEIWGDHFVDNAETVMLRARLCFEVPSVQGAMSLVINQEVDAIARVVAASGRWDFRTSRVLASGVIWAIMGVLRNWYDDGFTTHLREGVDEVLAWLPALEEVYS
ncbi:TetR/AcrR family transcriptional regulator [Actinomyces sp.]|uniref:TetR/AcrR family transcriptional regulator n=1 Tax=Actinomyces sp. TaxID=29317 RepID=UPI0026DAD2E0|nr:TetR/AcrR family transcriptional regulator [Actinomyces sp.]MDO4899476.1 TetR/AcrR family transcriptional regulator [Actinomyces sp.]